MDDVFTVFRMGEILVCLQAQDMDFASRNRFKMWKKENDRYKARTEAGRSKEEDLLMYHI